ASGVDLPARPQLVQDAGRLRVEPDVPGPMGLVDAAHRLDQGFDAEERSYPGLHDATECLERRAAVGDAHHRVVARFALPVERGVGTVQNVELNGAERALRLDDQAPYAAEARSGGVRLDRLGIGEQQVAVAQRRLLLAEKKLGG